ncbi:MAG: NADP-dependent oxidoreductase [Rhodobacterales bacterium]|nr:MAG: NADP-dependent oxidoreductase [Rhodobacterales bacterium]
MSEKNMQRIVLAQRPEGAVRAECFRLEDADRPSPAQGEVLIEADWLSLDPYQRGKMDAGPSYTAAVEIGAPMAGATVGRVLESRADGFAPGDLVLSESGWATHAALPAKELRKLDMMNGLPPQWALGVLGMPGFTGWYGLTEIGQPKEGETVVVGAATGPVGAMVGQIAKARGLRAVGIAGGPEKCAYAVETLGFDACLDHRGADAKTLRAGLHEACPAGIDIYFENVGGTVLEAVLPCMNTFGRIPLCGMVAWYDLDAAPTGADRLPLAWRMALVQRLTVQGFIISDHWDKLGAFLGEVAPLAAQGKVTIPEDVTEGLANAPDAFIRMLKGGNFGKTLVKL